MIYLQTKNLSLLLINRISYILHCLLLYHLTSSCCCTTVISVYSTFCHLLKYLKLSGIAIKTQCSVLVCFIIHVLILVLSDF